MKKFLLILIAPFLLISCTTTQKIDPNYTAYLNAMKNYHPKLVELKAQPGQTIELKGVAEFVVYAPTNGRSQIAVYRPQPNPAVAITHDFLHTVLGGAIQILPGYFGWRYGSSILKKAFDAAGDHYDVGGNYNTGTYANGDYTNGDKIGGDKYTAQGDIVGGDKVGGDKAGESIYKPGGDYVGGNKYTDSYNTTTTTTISDSNNKTTGDIDNGSVSQ